MNKYSIFLRTIGAILFFSVSTSVFADIQSAQAQDASTDSSYQLSTEVSAHYDQLLKNEAVNKGLAFLESDQENTVSQQIQIAAFDTGQLEWILDHNPMR